MAHESPATLREFRRPIILAITVSMFGELVIFIIYGVILYPSGNLLIKFFWTVVFCGIGMGASVGAMIMLFVVGRLRGWRAVLVTALISTMVLGLVCNYLCFSLDRHFHYFGGSENPVSFWTTGVLGSLASGILIGWLLFSDTGVQWLQRMNL